MRTIMIGAALVGLLLVVCGAIVTSSATNPTRAYLGTLIAGMGVLLLAGQGLARLFEF